MSKLISFVLFLVLFYFFFDFKDFLNERKRKKKFQRINYEDFDKIVLDSNDLIIIQNEYYSSATHQNEPVSFLIYETDFDGKTRKFVSEKINISNEGLIIKLEKKIKVDLYINRSDPDLYYFDLKNLVE
jgi:hypothetical protein